jgi:acyl-CoA thioester hydrolase
MKKTDLRPEHFPFTKEIEVRYRDQDTLNHVNNAVFNTYFEEARLDFAMQVPEFVQGVKENKSFVLVKTTIEYLGQITYPSHLIVGTGLKEKGNSSFTGVQAIFDKESGKIKAYAESKGIWFDLTRQRPARLPEIKDMDSWMMEL